MTSEPTYSKKVNIDHKQPPGSKPNEPDKPNEVVVENEPPNILKHTTQAKPQQPPISLEEACMVTMNERCSAVLLNKLSSKEKDPRSFTIPCQVSNLQIDNALSNLGASISLMPYTMYEKLGLRETKPTRISLELVDRAGDDEDAKPGLIRWVLLLQGFNIEIKDKKGAKNLAVNHLSRLENPHLEVLTEREIADEFPEEYLMMLKAKVDDVEPWYADYVNYIVGKVVPPKWITEKRKRFYSQGNNYLWDEPYAFKLCPDNIMRRCVAGSQIFKILAHCHFGPTRGHHSAFFTRRKRSGNISSRSEMPQNNIQVKAQALPTNDARVVVKILRGLFSRFGVPKALISDRETHFCNSQVERALKKYDVTYKLSIVYHPQSNGQTEVTNRDIKRILERSVGYNLKDCCRKNHLMQLNELAVLRDGAYENTRIYKERTKKWHDFRLRSDKDFKVGDKVLLFNSRFKMNPGNPKSKSYDLNTIKTVYPYRAVEITNKSRFSFKVNGQILKKYYEGNVDKEHDEVIEFEADAT
nr:hypothetical protein [Tanacetum cinerariifolium]